MFTFVLSAWMQHDDDDEQGNGRNTRPAPGQYARVLGGGKALAPLDPALRGFGLATACAHAEEAITPAAGRLGHPLR